jgi:hypothetical protein
MAARRSPSRTKGPSRKGPARTKGPFKYPPLRSSLPAHLEARLQATATVLRVPTDQVAAESLDRFIASLPAQQRELIDRVAASLLLASEI